MSAHGSWLPTLGFAVLIALALYVRVRRTFGRQTVRPGRMMFRIGLLTLVAGTIVASAPVGSIVGALAGTLVGAALALLGLAHTEFEVSADGRFYTPNKWIGLGVTALFLGRLAARFANLQDVMGRAQAGSGGLEPTRSSPITLAIFFVMAAYYVVYYAGVLRRSRSRAATAVG